MPAFECRERLFAVAGRLQKRHAVGRPVQRRAQAFPDPVLVVRNQHGQKRLMHARSPFWEYTG